VVQPLDVQVRGEAGIGDVEDRAVVGLVDDRVLPAALPGDPVGDLDAPPVGIGVGRHEPDRGDRLLRVRVDHEDPTPAVAGHPVLVVLREHDGGDAELADVAHALDLPRLLARAPQRGQQDADQDRDDADHHEQLDERETRAGRPDGATLHVNVTRRGTASRRHLCNLRTAPVCLCVCSLA
jgi:hypothetical protein